ncbi:hypothetical protein ADUPG1_010478, partial [Aduncisulcus paluster]
MSSDISGFTPIPQKAILLDEDLQSQALKVFSESSEALLNRIMPLALSSSFAAASFSSYLHKEISKMKKKIKQVLSSLPQPAHDDIKYIKSYWKRTVPILDTFSIQTEKNIKRRQKRQILKRGLAYHSSLDDDDTADLLMSGMASGKESKEGLGPSKGTTIKSLTGESVLPKQSGNSKDKILKFHSSNRILAEDFSCKTPPLQAYEP